MRRFSRIFAWTTLFFVAGAVLFFTKAAALPYKVAWPVLLLSLATFLSRRRELLPFGFAFLFSAAGDAVGARGLFIPQMAFFALAHAAYGFRCAALLFVFSDAVIAWNRFIGPVPARTWIVMITYYLAQYLFFRFAFKTAARN
mgnify:CR=1 FL=1